ncbi:MAG TPA: STAS domain-containing protein [Phycisphaerales bacterium]|nr:STAS domain-containing protein [Phycisphaerales bacterium]
MWNLLTKIAGANTPELDQAQDLAQQNLQTEPPATIKSGLARVEPVGSVAVATFTVTHLSREQGAESLTELLDGLMNMGASHLILDIQNVQYMDSACLGSLVAALNRMAASGGQIALVNTATSVQDLFRMTRLDRVFPICKDVMSALKKLGQLPDEPLG